MPIIDNQNQEEGQSDIHYNDVKVMRKPWQPHKPARFLPT